MFRFSLELPSFGNFSKFKLPFKVADVLPSPPGDEFAPKLFLYNGTPLKVGTFKTYYGIFHPLMPDEINPVYYFYQHVSVSLESTMMIVIRNAGQTTTGFSTWSSTG